MQAAQASPIADSAKEIVKQGLSEYFIFTIDGTETLPNNSRKRNTATARSSTATTWPAFYS